LYVERSERCRDSGSNSHNAAFQVQSDKGNPEVISEKQSRSARSGRASRVCRAVTDHFFIRTFMPWDKTPAPDLVLPIHVHLQRTT
jgi:hypothetical protein